MDFNRYNTPYSHEEIMRRCARIKHVALDMDGTIYMGNHLFPYTIPFLDSLRDMGISYSFLTNNPTKSANDYLARLKQFGIQADVNQMYTSAMATIDFIHSHYPQVHKIFALGTPSMQKEFQDAGFELCKDDAKDRPDLLLVAFDTTLTYPRLCRAAWWAAQPEIPYIATNPDWVCPTDQPTILVDCGSLCQCIEGATKRRPDIVIGKPNAEMITCISEKYGLKNDEIAMVGDRIYTDVQTAFNSGSLGILVLSGETTLETAMSAPRHPDITALNIEIFGQLLEESRHK